jgi:hypothetical protein
MRGIRIASKTESIVLNSACTIVCVSRSPEPHVSEPNSSVASSELVAELEFELKD